MVLNGPKVLKSDWLQTSSRRTKAEKGKTRLALSGNINYTIKYNPAKNKIATGTLVI